MYQKRTYRKSIKSEDLIHFNVTVFESDLRISIQKKVLDNYKPQHFKKIAEDILTKYRRDLENYILANSLFRTSYKPVEIAKDAPPIVKDMAVAAKLANVGPMAGVAGAVAEYVGQDLLKYSTEVMVENGGDIFLATTKTRKVGIYTNNPKFTDKVILEINPADSPLGVCTSSGTLGHSVSFGQADAAVIVAKSATVADAFATAIGNMIKSAEDIEQAIEYAGQFKEISGVIIIKDDKLGAWGKIKLLES
jgi:uncharacterized protein